MSSVLAPPRATLADLARVEGKAELVAGGVVTIPATGHRPSVVAGRIYRRLAEYADAAGRGVAFTQNMAFAVTELSTGRESFSPDASFYTGPLPPDRMKFVSGPPDFAVEVRSEGDYGPAAELAMATKRAEYFEAGTRVVWDVDPVANVVHRYRPGVAAPTVFGPGTEADAEPAVPGWRLPLDWLMA
ncbi:MAG TPA: Uma2 family endonuclease [Urbifossiella sp.]|nr:Uma2 family endonuclease [Urbifossiella sp.]